MSSDIIRLMARIGQITFTTASVIAVVGAFVLLGLGLSVF